MKNSWHEGVNPDLCPAIFTSCLMRLSGSGFKCSSQMSTRRGRIGGQSDVHLDLILMQLQLQSFHGEGGKSYINDRHEPKVLSCLNINKQHRPDVYFAHLPSQNKHLILLPW